ncbi:MAG: glycosyltransferase [Burkholderiales bacterium]|nr:glycosyltransferase [Burkholderiales bacterium]
MIASQLVSVVITTYNRSDALLAVLEGLRQQTDPHFEVIVADDGSRAEHRCAILESDVARALKVVHVWHPDVGFTASRIRNRGVAASGGTYLVFMDGDCVPEVDFIARHKALAQRIGNSTPRGEVAWVLSAKRQRYCALAVGVAAQYRKGQTLHQNPPGSTAHAQQSRSQSKPPFCPVTNGRALVHLVVRCGLRCQIPVRLALHPVIDLRVTVIPQRWPACRGDMWGI